MEDYAHETRLVRSPVVRAVWLALGFLFTGLAFLGVVMPLIPTTPFLLLAAFCFARSSVRFYNWLLNNPHFGELIRDWRAGRGLTLRVKVLAIGLLALTMSISALFFVPVLAGQLSLLVIGVGVSIYLLRQPTKPEPQQA